MMKSDTLLQAFQRRAEKHRRGTQVVRGLDMHQRWAARGHVIGRRMRMDFSFCLLERGSGVEPALIGSPSGQNPNGSWHYLAVRGCLRRSLGAGALIWIEASA